ncbi:telomere-associated protein Tap [Actinacidiphila bryophytorum]|uniref:Helix-turn-helix domain-containing protein n=2 Tax=Actinacidiphila bryophytorum TaxID=1436133 RepID=A0A9W4H7X5_9ACTN|nr:helix-turn-helix transcriptional regulator [Actinacidiphila bryophytorum]MBM9440260.1 helix-turn-helix domain-containing protein [Actinacidiphila bryophytorum]CAG7658467.1 Helix-turn-helix domain-containing protein [Actinacidiphila bryophytorum]
MPTEDELFSAVDALLDEVAAAEALPPPAERRRLREAAGLSQAQVAAAVDTRREAVGNWESGRTDPRPPQRAAYARLLEGLATRFPAPAAPPAPEPAPAVRPVVRAAPAAPPAPDPAPAPAEAAAPATPAAPRAPEPAPTPAAEPVAPTAPAAVPEPAVAEAPRAAPASPSRPRSAARPQLARRTQPRKPAAATGTATDPRFVNGPLGVLDGDGSLYCAGGLVLPCPAASVPDLVEWTLAEARLGAARLHRSGKDSDPLVVLTAGAAARLGLPERLADRRQMRLPDDHKVVRQIARAKWQLTRRGFGPWARVYRPASGGERRCVQLAVLPWDALDARAWGSAGELPPAELARVLTAYAARVLTPRGSTAVAGLELMSALRPPTRAVKDEATGTWVPGPVPGSLTRAFDPAPPEAPDEHPVVAALHPRAHQRDEAEVLDEEAFDWIRGADLLTDAECAKPFAVGVDVNTAFLAAANRLVVGLSGPEHVRAPRFDKSVPGCWLVDLSGIETDPRLPSPFTPHGGRPTGPAWYATPTVAYAQELVDTFGLPVEVRPAEAYVRREAGPYLDPWYKHLTDAYKLTMADLGVTADLSPYDFLTAMERHKQGDPGMAAVLSAVKSTVKGGIGKLRERPQGAGYRPGERWPALERPTWRPDIRAAVIAAARVNMHRKLVRTALATQSGPPPAGSVVFGDDALLPVALLSDCAVYPSPGPSPLDVLPYGTDGKPAPGTFRLGVSPGMVKHEGTQPLFWAVELMEQQYNPARHIKGDGAQDDGE